MSKSGERVNICGGCVTTVSHRFLLAYMRQTQIDACGFCGQLRDIVAKASPPRTMISDRGTKLKAN